MHHRFSKGLNTFETPGGVAKFAIIAAVPATMVSATFGVVSLSLAGYADWSDFRSIWMTWWIGDLAGALVIAPIIILWGATSFASFKRENPSQSFLVYGAAIAVGLVAFSPLLDEMPGRTALAFAAILPLMWAALWRNQRDTATVAILLSVFAVWGTVSGAGPFVQDNLNDSFLLLLAFMLSASIPSLALSAEVISRKRHEEHIAFVVRELSHRSKNLLSVVQSMARQLARQSNSYEEFLGGLNTRLKAFADTQDLLVTGNWRGAELGEVVRLQLAPFHNAGTKAIRADGPPLRLSPKAVEQVGLALHELATNAVKHGALSSASGTVTIRWQLETNDIQRRALRFTWQEAGGPPVRPAQKIGFGHQVIVKLVPAALRGTASLEFPLEGVKYVLLVPQSSISCEDEKPSSAAWQGDEASAARGVSLPQPSALLD